MSSSDSPTIHRSISMPAKPQPLQSRPMKRSQEKETLIENDYYPESPSCERRKKSFDGNRERCLGSTNTQSASNFFTTEWAGSTIELNSDLRRNAEVDTFYYRRKPYRVIEKNGRENVTFKKIPEKSWRYIRDFVTTLVRWILPKRYLTYLTTTTSATSITVNNTPKTLTISEQKLTAKEENDDGNNICYEETLDFSQNTRKRIELDWKYMLTMFIGSYFLSWTFFAILCYMVAFSHGDLMFDEVTGERLGEGKDPCIIGVYDFTSMLIYSIETQTTIGFGEKYPSEECPETMFLFILQIICSIAIEGGMISIIYTKTARPAKQLTKLKFSDKAVICHRDGKLCLLFRVCDPREQQTIESKIRVYMIIDKPTKEGELIKTHTELKLENNGQQIIIWPEIVCHVIDKTSPLSHFKCAKDVTNAQFELYVSIVGISAATAQVTEARTSYVPREIFWGQRFINVIKYDSLGERYIIDYGNFNTTISVDMNHNVTETMEIENEKFDN